MGTDAFRAEGFASAGRFHFIVLPHGSRGKPQSLAVEVRIARLALRKINALG